MESHAESPPNGKSAGDGHGQTLGQHVDRVSHTAQNAWAATRSAVSDLRGTLDIDGRVQRNPYGMVAAALGIGYVLGGGLFSPLTGRVVGLGMRIGLRLAVLPLLKRELTELADAFQEGQEGGHEGSSKRPRTRSNENKEK
jgi:hypothetical protein